MSKLDKVCVCKNGARGVGAHNLIAYRHAKLSFVLKLRPEMSTHAAKTYDAVHSADRAEGDVEMAVVGGTPNTSIHLLEDGTEVRARSETSRIRALTTTPLDNENSPTILTFSNIRVSTKTGNKKVLLHDVSGTITGGFWAIMGSSGGGKTTLLSTLSLRLDPSFMEIQGEIRLNGREYTKKTLKAMSAYVMQDDLLHAELTVAETLHYAALLRMPESQPMEEIRAREAEVLKLMGISHCSDTIVGNTRKKGISGGERKRLCVAIELLNHPKLVFLDEPTSGLDSTTALSVCQALKNLSDIGECTVVCTIHQPQPKIFNLFDNLILMKQGNIVYQGAAQKATNFLLQVGMPLPADVSLADYLLDVVSPTKEDGDKVDDYRLIPPVDLSSGYEKQRFVEEGATSWTNQYQVLVRRNWQQYFRRKDNIFMNFMATSVLALFVSLGVWRDIGTTNASISTRAPSLFFTCVTQGVLGSLQAINSFPSERAIMLRERQSGAYHVSSYFMAKTTVDLITQLWPPILFTCIVYYTIGYQPLARKFFMYMFFMILDSLAATGLAQAITCVCVSVEMSTIVLSALFEMCRLYGGFFASPAQLAVPRMHAWRFADTLSYLKYAFVGVALNEFHGLNLDPPASGSCTSQALASGSCYTEGSQIIEIRGYDEYTIGQ
jgi:ATP-binding cassette subfamily G (WHITE) protein 2